MRVGSLFSGIGGIDLGLERAGYEIRWQVEIDPYCRKVLARHWPHVRRYGDIRAIDWSAVEPVDLVCGGFPCQPVSIAGKRRGTADDRWLWPEFARCIGVLRPRYVLLENVPAILSADDGRLFAGILWDLAACGYDAEWDCIPARSVGAPHQRDRLWLVAYADRKYGETRMGRWTKTPAGAPDGSTNPRAPWMEPFPGIRGVADGVPNRVDRLRGLGNAVVPQIVTWLSEQIIGHGEGGDT